MSKIDPTKKSQPMRGKCVLDPETKKKRFKIRHPRLLDIFLELHCKVGDEMTIWFESKRPKRTLQQNNYMHLYFYLIGRSSGHTMIEIKNWAKKKFLSGGITEVFGEDVREVQETSNLTIGETCEFILRIEEATGIPAPSTEPFLKALTHKEYEKLSENQRRAYESMKSKIVINPQD